MSIDYKIWDDIYALRNKIKTETPSLRNKKIKRTYKDENGIVRCSRCGSSNNIDACGDCLLMKSSVA